MACGPLLVITHVIITIMFLMMYNLDCVDFRIYMSLSVYPIVALVKC